MDDMIMRVIYRLITQNRRSEFLVYHRMFNPKVFMDKIAKKESVIEAGGAEKVLTQMLIDGYIVQRMGPDYYHSYMQITDKFSDELKKKTKYVLRIPEKSWKEVQQETKRKVRNEVKRRLADAGSKPIKGAFLRPQKNLTKAAKDRFLNKFPVE